MDIRCLVNDIQLGMITLGLKGPLDIVMSTFDLNLNLFISEFYDPENSYDIWYWYIERNFNLDNLPRNIRLHQLERNHAKFWYLKGKDQVRLVITSANMTTQMIHGCLQSFVSVTCSLSKGLKQSLDYSTLEREYNTELNDFFSVYGFRMDLALYNMIKGRLLYNIPNRRHAIENWYLSQNELVVDSNNVNLNYLPTVKRTFYLRNTIPPSANKIICYYNENINDGNIKRTLTTIYTPYTTVFHYKIYYTDTCLLISSNNFSLNHRMNYELGMLIDGKQL